MALYTQTARGCGTCGLRRQTSGLPLAPVSFEQMLVPDIFRDVCIAKEGRSRHTHHPSSLGVLNPGLLPLLEGKLVRVSCRRCGCTCSVTGCIRVWPHVQPASAGPADKSSHHEHARAQPACWALSAGIRPLARECPVFGRHAGSQEMG